MLGTFLSKLVAKHSGNTYFRCISMIFRPFTLSFSLKVHFRQIGAKLHFELIVIIKVDIINDNVVTTGRKISNQRPLVIYSASGE